MCRGKTTLLSAFLIGCLLSPTFCSAAPWVDPGQAQLRHHIQVLADAGVINTPITTWPLPWASISPTLEYASQRQLPESVRWSLSYVRFYLERTQHPVAVQARAGHRADPDIFRSFGSEQREENEITGSIDWLGDALAARLSLNWAPDATDDRDYRLDGSYLAAVMGNWAVSLGAQERWWGPGWQSSLILSNNARPVTAISLQRQAARPFETPLLSWLGPWSVTAFAGQLESRRAVPDAQLLGARLTIKPFTVLELGFSHVAMEGGSRRARDAARWITDSDSADDAISAIDLRLGFSIAQTQLGFYAQHASADSKNLSHQASDLAGIESGFVVGNLYHRLALEYSNTTAGAYGYRHYPTGHRYYGRTLGTSFDSDSRALSLLLDQYLPNESQLSWRLSKIDLPSAGISFSSHNSTLQAEVSYAFVIKNFKISTGVYTVSEEFYWNNQKIDGTGLSVAVEYRLE